MARFSEPMRAGTLNRTSVRLVRRGRASAVRARVRYSGASRIVTLDPGAALARGATYTARVAGPRDPSGNALAPVKSWSFTVRR
ncbi:MAG: Ig-like domain-containing protein [Actinomycetota bacterium]|nr:Ig-like domain-containing protein [Actinomycetota bacterium]